MLFLLLLSMSSRLLRSVLGSTCHSSPSHTTLGWLDVRIELVASPFFDPACKLLQKMGATRTILHTKVLSSTLKSVGWIKHVKLRYLLVIIFRFFYQRYTRVKTLTPELASPESIFLNKSFYFNNLFFNAKSHLRH